jgi:hypothetical protein
LGGDASSTCSLRDCGVRLRAGAGGSPAASHFSLLRQRKVTKRKATLFVVPTLRYWHATVLGQSGVSCKLASLKQARALIRFALRSSPPLQGVKREGKCEFACKRFALACFPNPRQHFSSHPVLAGPSSADGGGRSGQTCLSEASCLDRRRNRAAQVARSAAKGPRLRVAFSLVTFLLAKQKKVTSRRATPGQQLSAKSTAPGALPC